MFKNKVAVILLVMFMTLAIAGGALFISWDYITAETDSSAEPSIDEIIERSYDTEEMTTNLLNGGFVRSKYKIQLDSKEALHELEKRDFQVTNIVLTTLSGKEAKELAGPEGKTQLEEELKEQINTLMQEGSVQKVYMTEWVVQ
ncbi:flagellar basal body-associated protein FliL [Alkalicoccobacillus porphyridii]|uniref:Flagellar protein FliL n=1 Tax=Alkalicoccobacillus porphyridii TaxID=2597270 RepID=A0A553ZY94_9BACI|nr:flagellar basal body-associated protein FliL [Alkalicoccobacillus porphyridii]TSB46418.1 flagellar basal body-associated protein FliL [Alkalicoccobacillus porphyridii]